MKEFNCDCEDWKINIKIVDAPYTMGLTVFEGGYWGKIFKYCPWCGKELLAHNVAIAPDTNIECNCNNIGYSESTGGCPVHGVKY